jgi:hypothetical protein
MPTGTPILLAFYLVAAETTVESADFDRHPPISSKMSV